MEHGQGMLAKANLGLRGMHSVKNHDKSDAFLPALWAATKHDEVLSKSKRAGKNPFDTRPLYRMEWLNGDADR